MCLHVNIWLCLSKEWESNPDAPDGPSDLFHPGWSVRFSSLWTKALSIHQTHPEIHRPATRYPCGLGHLKQQKYTDRSFFLKSGVKEWQKRFSNWPKFPGSRMAMEKVRDITRWDFKDEKQCFKFSPLYSRQPVKWCQNRKDTISRPGFSLQQIAVRGSYNSPNRM